LGAWSKGLAVKTAPGGCAAKPACAGSDETRRFDRYSRNSKLAAHEGSASAKGQRRWHVMPAALPLLLVEARGGRLSLGQHARRRRTSAPAGEKPALQVAPHPTPVGETPTLQVRRGAMGCLTEEGLQSTLEAEVGAIRFPVRIDGEDEDGT